MMTRLQHRIAHSLILLTSCAALATVLTGCQANVRVSTQTGLGSMRIVEASQATDAALLGRLKALEGTWEVQDDQGTWVTASVFTVTSSGSVVKETMFPGTPHEMTNMYSMDGETLILTHYCAMGNQPRMRCKQATSEGGFTTLEFEPVAVTNWRKEHQGAMGRVKLELRTPTEIAQQWEMVMPPGVDESSDHNPTFVLRKKAG